MKSISTSCVLLILLSSLSVCKADNGILQSVGYVFGVLIIAGILFIFFNYYCPGCPCHKQVAWQINSRFVNSSGVPIYGNGIVSGPIPTYTTAYVIQVDANQQHQPAQGAGHGHPIVMNQPMAPTLNTSLYPVPNPTS